MKTIHKIFLVVILVTLSTFSLTSCSDTEGSNELKTENIADSRAISVEVEKTVGKVYTDFISVLGTVKSSQRASLSYAEGGKIEEVLKDKGSFVNAGDTIIVIDNDVLKATLDAARAQYDLDQITYEKQAQIYNENINSEYQYLQAKFRRDQSKANYELIKARYDKTFIAAPFTGVVDKKYYELGEFALPGAPIVEVINNNSYKIEAGVPERYVGQVTVGDKCTIKLKNISDGDIEGVVKFVGTSISTDNRTFPVEVGIHKNSKLLKPEVAAEVYIENGNYKNVITIPDEIVSRLDDGYVVFVEENGVARARSIKILNRAGSEVAVLNGLKENENLIVVGYQNLVEGQKIKVVN